MLNFFLSIFLIFITSCQTPYKEGLYGINGGYRVQEFNGTYTIYYSINGCTKLRKGIDFVALKASQIAMNKGFMKFDLKKIESYSTVTKNSYSSHLVIDVIIGDKGAFEASNICNMVTNKYGGVSNTDVFKEKINCGNNTSPDNSYKQMELFYTQFENLDYVHM